MRLRAALVVLAIGVALVPIPSGAVERVYSTRIYAALQPAVTSLSNRVPFVLLDLLVIAVVVAWIVAASSDFARARTRGWLVIAGRVALRTVVWAACAYLAFVALWGLNYRRIRLEQTLAFDAGKVDAGNTLALSRTAVERVNALYEAAHAAGWETTLGVDPVLAAAVADAARSVGAQQPAMGRPKRTLADWYFRRAGVSGMTDPFFLETIVASDVLPFERPFVIAHEWSHLAGIVDEGEANFVAWLACIRAAPPDRYSGWLFLYEQLLPSLASADRAAVAALLAPGPQDDLRASRERYLRNVSPRVSAAGWRVYDSYLKANRVEAGAASYAEVVRLVLGVPLDADGRPVRRARP
jgi:Protein of unknown function (DUF3810)